MFMELSHFSGEVFNFFLEDLPGPPGAPLAPQSSPSSLRYYIAMAQEDCLGFRAGIMFLRIYMCGVQATENSDM